MISTANSGGNETPVIDRPPCLTPVNDETPQKPPMYAVILHNDGSSNPAFVVGVLNTIFSIEPQHAIKIMLGAHISGKSLIQITSKDMAETKVRNAAVLAMSAVSGQDYNAETSQTGQCELTFTVELETRGE